MITIEHIMASARQASGVENSTDSDFQEGLGVYVRALNEEARLTENGEKVLTQSLINYLMNRLQVNQYLDQHQELLANPIEKPLFVFGLPRTGTTLAINLLNADPQRRCMLRWEVLQPVPPAAAGALLSDPRCAKEQEKLDWSARHLPHISAIHHEDADSPAECQFSMALTFCAQVLEAQADVPTYRNWFLHEADYLPALKQQKKLLQLLQAENQGKWTLKNPWYPLFLDELAFVYPDARMVMTHRDPVEVIGSACSLIKNVRHLFSDHVDNEAIGRSMVDTFTLMIERATAYRQKHGWNSIYDVQYTELVKNPISVMKDLYRWLGEDLSEQAQQCMLNMLEEKPKNKFGKHSYTLEEYGLNKDQIREQFKDYCDTFGVVVSK